MTPPADGSLRVALGSAAGGTQLMSRGQPVWPQSTARARLYLDHRALGFVQNDGRYSTGEGAMALRCCAGSLNVAYAASASADPPFSREPLASRVSRRVAHARAGAACGKWRRETGDRPRSPHRPPRLLQRRTRTVGERVQHDVGHDPVPPVLTSASLRRVGRQRARVRLRARASGSGLGCIEARRGRQVILSRGRYRAQSDSADSTNARRR